MYVEIIASWSAFMKIKTTNINFISKWSENEARYIVAKLKNVKTSQSQLFHNFTIKSA